MYPVAPVTTHRTRSIVVPGAPTAVSDHRARGAGPAAPFDVRTLDPSRNPCTPGVTPGRGSVGVSRAKWPCRGIRAPSPLESLPLREPDAPRRSAVRRPTARAGRSVVGEVEVCGCGVTTWGPEERSASRWVATGWVRHVGVGRALAARPAGGRPGVGGLCRRGRSAPSSTRASGAATERPVGDRALATLDGTPRPAAEPTPIFNELSVDRSRNIPRPSRPARPRRGARPGAAPGLRRAADPGRGVGTAGTAPRTRSARRADRAPAAGSRGRGEPGGRASPPRRAPPPPDGDGREDAGARAGATPGAARRPGPGGTRCVADAADGYRSVGSLITGRPGAPDGGCPAAAAAGAMLRHPRGPVGPPARPVPPPPSSRPVEVALRAHPSSRPAHAGRHLHQGRGRHPAQPRAAHAKATPLLEKAAPSLPGPGPVRAPPAGQHRRRRQDRGRRAAGRQQVPAPGVAGPRRDPHPDHVAGSPVLGEVRPGREGRPSSSSSSRTSASSAA